MYMNINKAGCQKASYFRNMLAFFFEGLTPGLNIFDMVTLNENNMVRLDSPPNQNLGCSDATGGTVCLAREKHQSNSSSKVKLANGQSAPVKQI